MTPWRDVRNLKKKKKKKKKNRSCVIRTHARPRVSGRCQPLRNKSDLILNCKIKVLINIYDAVLKILIELIERDRRDARFPRRSKRRNRFCRSRIGLVPVVVAQDLCIGRVCDWYDVNRYCYKCTYMKIFCSDWPYLIRNHLSCVCVLFSKIYPKITFTAKNWSDLCNFYSKVIFFFFFVLFCIGKYFLLFHAEFELLMFCNIFVKISDKLN